MDLWSVINISNIYAISDPRESKQALLQVIIAMRDAVSLPWPAVRAVWASSIHQVEEVHPSWADSMQWAINRLSTSQVALAHTQTTTQPTSPRRPCKYFNERSCSHEGHHGSYAHFCSHCLKQGKNLNHPESRCNAKQRQAGRQQQNSSWGLSESLGHSCDNTMSLHDKLGCNGCNSPLLIFPPKNSTVRLWLVSV